MCGRVFLLVGGKIIRCGTPSEVLPEYLSTAHRVSAERTWHDSAAVPGNDIVRLHKVRVHEKNGITVETHDIRSPVGVETEYDVLLPGHVLIPSYHFFNEDGFLLFVVQDVFSEWRHILRRAGRYRITAWLPGNFLAEGRVTVDIAVSSHVPSRQIHFMKRHAVGFQVIDNHDGDSARGDFKGMLPGVVRPVVQWSTSRTGLAETAILDYGPL
jgi:lipopolysaccharide transport system ATP-binding protein